jgi:hypothetical protein
VFYAPSGGAARDPYSIGGRVTLYILLCVSMFVWLLLP